MARNPRHAAVLIALVLPLQAVEIRNYQAARHDRFTGFPAAPEFNTGAFYTSGKFTGIAWVPGGGDNRQFTLVTPRHFVCAAHFQPGIGSTVRFLGGNGTIVDRTVVALQTVSPSDLTLATLSSAIPASAGVAHFPYLNLAGENSYLNRTLTIFGMNAKAGGGRLARFSTQFDTRVMEFDYRINLGGQDDCYLIVGDSGSPSFATVNNQPALVGLHFLVSDTPLTLTGYDTFVPEYIEELDAFLAPEGYRMRPATIPSYSLAAAESPPPSLRQAHPATLGFNLANSSAVDAGNAKLTFVFPAGADPQSIAAPGWIQETSGPGEWKFRRAVLAAGDSATFNAVWTALPATGSLSIGLDHSADGSPAGSHVFNHILLPSYAAWSAGLAEAALGDDPDHDGVTNLLEYAFGGDPESATPESASGGPLLPLITTSTAAVLRFPVREDSAARGLSYNLEFSESLAALSWSPTPPPGFFQGDLDFSPVSPDFKNRTVSFSTSAPRRFCRVRVELDE